MSCLTKQYADPATGYKRWLDRVSPTSKKVLRKRNCVLHPLPAASVKQASQHVKKISVSSGDILDLVRVTQKGLDQGKSPMVCEDGTGGVYFLKGEQSEFISVFKPRDEEYMCPNNPKGYVQTGAVVGISENVSHPGFTLGDGAKREQAAYVLDAVYGGFHGVPKTTMAYMQLEVGGRFKEGSLQEYVKGSVSAEDVGTGCFRTEDVQRIGLLDIRLCNTDRHAANILLTKEAGRKEAGYKMVPVDHGLCLPRWQHLESVRFEWLNWKQSKEPLKKQHLKLIKSLDVDRDAAILRGLHFEEDAVTTLRICTTLLKVCALSGMTLFQIGSLMQREGDGETPSVLEELVGKASKKLCTKVRDLNQRSEIFHNLLVLLFEMELKSYLSRQGKPAV